MEQIQPKTCAACDQIIAPDQPYKTAILSPEAAAGLMENIYDPRLVVAWNQSEDGSVQIDLCLKCAEGMKGAEDLEIKYNS